MNTLPREMTAVINSKSDILPFAQPNNNKMIIIIIIKKNLKDCLWYVHHTRHIRLVSVKQVLLNFKELVKG